MKTLFVNGTLMRGLALHANLDGAVFLGEARTMPRYRLHSIGDRHPGMFETASGGVSVAGELYEMSEEVWRRVRDGEPPHLYCGPVALNDGRVVDGILFPENEAQKHEDISAFGDWRAYLASKNHKENVMREIAAEPYAFEFIPEKTALAVIDMQRDFLEPGGFGQMLGNDVSLLRSCIEPAQKVLEAARKAGLMVLHTREGHAPHLLDLQPNKRIRGRGAKTIGDDGPMGRILVRGEVGHDIIPELSPLPGEYVVDKPGKGAFYATDLEHVLRQRDIRYLLVCGVTTEVCVHTTVREANDRGFECLVVSDATGSYFPEFKRVGLEMIKAQGGIFGWVADSAAVIKGIQG